MSATLTTQEYSRRVAVGYVDHLGYTRCTTCHHEHAVQGTRLVLQRRGSHDLHTCNFCQAELFEHSIEIESGVEIVEHVTCKIF